MVYPNNSCRCSTQKAPKLAPSPPLPLLLPNLSFCQALLILKLKRKTVMNLSLTPPRLLRALATLCLWPLQCLMQMTALAFRVREGPETLNERVRDI